MRLFVPAFDALWKGSKASLHNSTRAIFLKLCQEARDAERGGAVVLPKGRDDADSVGKLCPGTRVEIALAIEEMTDSDDPMISIADDGGRRVLRVLWWVDVADTLQDPVRAIRNGRRRRWKDKWKCRQDLRVAVVGRDMGRCRYCGVDVSHDPTMDHVKPRIDGGDDGMYNIVLACRACNSRKGARTPDQAGMPLLPIGGG